MKVLRITVANIMVGDDERKFNDMLTDMFISANFDLQQPIIRQNRSDVEAIDFIQLRYSIWDKVYVFALHDYWRFKLWLKRQFEKPEETKKLKNKKNEKGVKHSK